VDTTPNFPAAVVLGVLAANLLLGTSLLHAQVVRQVTDVRTGLTSLGALDDAGTWVFAISAADPFGTNPEHTYQIFRWDASTGDGEQITAFDEGVEPPQVIGTKTGDGPWIFHPDSLSVSDDGQWLVFVSRGDLTGLNPDRSQELFVMRPDGSGLLQLTDSPSASAGSIYHYEISGGGNRVVFSSTVDYGGLGSNPDHDAHAFVVNTDGTGLLELPSIHDGGAWPSISDDGQRVAFSWQWIQGVQADGTNLHAIAPGGGPLQISGDGSTVVYQGEGPNDQPGWCDGGLQIAAADWDGGNVTQLTGICLGATVAGTALLPSVTDDGQVVIYSANDFYEWEIWRVNRDASGHQPLAWGPGACTAARVSGSGGRVAFVCEDGEPFGMPNPDLSRELYAMSGSGSDWIKLSEGTDGNSYQPDLTADGRWIAFISDANPLGEAPGIGTQVYRVASDGSDLARLTGFTEEIPRRPVISDDGSLIAFIAEKYSEHRIFTVQADGSGLTPVTPIVPGWNDAYRFGALDISGDGSVIVFDSGYDLTGEDPPQEHNVYRVDPDGTGLSLVAPGWYPRVDATATWVTYQEGCCGGDIYLARLDGQDTIVVGSANYWGEPDISATGQSVAWESRNDPLGTNPEGNSEIFLYEATTGRTRQLTSTRTWHNEHQSISGDGAFVYYRSMAPYGSNDPEVYRLMRVNVETGLVERVGALRPCELSGDPRPIVANGDGTLAVFAGGRDCTGMNPDGELELYLVDRNTPPEIRVSPGDDPTLLSWDVASGPIRYDVIRGDVAALSLAAGGTVDLGDVVCIENDSVDADTRSFEDSEQPGPDQVFFYLFRGSEGDQAPGSYGRASTGEERLPSSGGCAD
jgi:Tol biopolymer transport system component